MIPMYEYFDDLYGESLEHHGIFGMKWGIRRFQNKDGSLTPAGKRQAEKRAAKEAKNKAKTKEQEAKKKAKTKEQEAKAAAKAEEAEKKLRSDIDKAIANVDMKQLSKLKSSMSDEDLKRFAARAQSLGQVGENLGKYNKNLPPSAYERVLSGISGLKAGVDAATGLKQSLRAAKAEFFPKKKEAEGDNQNNQNNQNNKKQNDNAVTSKQMDDRFEKMMNRLTKEVTTLVKERPKDQNGGKQEKQPKQEPKQKEKKLDIFEHEPKSWSPPSLAKTTPVSSLPKFDLSSFQASKRIEKAGQIFQDTTPHVPTQREKNDSFINKLSSISRDMSMERINKRNASGWTATNNDQWLSVLKDASNVHLGDGEWNKYNKYK